MRLSCGSFNGLNGPSFRQMLKATTTVRVSETAADGSTADPGEQRGISPGRLAACRRQGRHQGEPRPRPGGGAQRAAGGTGLAGGRHPSAAHHHPNHSQLGEGLTKPRVIEFSRSPSRAIPLYAASSMLARRPEVRKPSRGARRRWRRLRKQRNNAERRIWKNLCQCLFSLRALAHDLLL